MAAAPAVPIPSRKSEPQRSEMRSGNGETQPREITSRAEPQVREPPPGNGEPQQREVEEEPGLTSAERWHRTVEAIRQRSPRLGTSLAYGRLVALRPGEAVLSFPGGAAFHRATVAGSGLETLEAEISQILGSATRIVLDDTKNGAAGASPSLVEHEETQRADRERTVESKVRQHPAVQASIRILGGEIERIDVLEAHRTPDPDAPADSGPAAETER